MRWKSGRRSDNVEDRRGSASGGFASRGARLPARIGKRGLGGGLGTIVLLLAALYFGVDPSLILEGGLGTGPATVHNQAPSSPPARQSAEDARLADFVSVVLADTEDTWNALFAQLDARYREPKLVLFSGSVSSACGYAKAAMGPFYCPGDHKVYIDLSFYEDMRRNYGAPGDFAQAYVIAHEVGHHVQNLLGISSEVQKAKAKSSKAEGNKLSVRLELQADCLAGVWAYHADKARGILEQGDVEEALTAAAAIGDDRLQKQSRGYVTPDSFTHGSSQQRVRWFKKGLSDGKLKTCDTFSVREL
jgi:hypothetical protein